METVASAALVGALYVLTPGPGFLAIMASTASQSAAAGARFVTGMLCGSSTWLAVALASLNGAQALPPAAVAGLNLACSAYLAHFAFRLCATGGRSGDVRQMRKPFAEGLALALCNPKAYPVFAGLLAAIGPLGWSGNGTFALAWASCLAGVACSYAAMLKFARTPRIAAAFKKHNAAFRHAFAAAFAFYAVSLGVEALRAL